ncbi:MAG TPA: SAM-dependent methyltransferase [Lacunisphaera sp.]|nr:SAM-dependent methyltransferase [Lacunisphaera sp.]
MTAPEQFLDLLRAAVRDGTLARLTLGKPKTADRTLRQLFVRPVTLRGTTQLSLVWRHDRQDITKNFPPDEALRIITPLIGTDFHSAHLFTPAQVAQLEYNKKGQPRLTFGPAVESAADDAHDRAKVRILPPESQGWLERLGVTTPQGAVREHQADKHRQIHKFVEILSHLVADANLAPDRPIEVADMGCGKGYLTFAAHDYFTLVLRRAAHVRGIEARAELVELCNRVARETGRSGLEFETGSIATTSLPSLDLLIALHACDTATDDALAKGVQAGATLLVVAPCCQKELRPQLTAAPVLAPALRHGIFQERHAEFATDALRALLLEWAGYDTKVFEFISTEHTAKNLMIAATRRADDARTAEATARVRELAAFYGIKSQALARHLGFVL